MKPNESTDRPTFTVTLRAELGADHNSVLRSMRRFLKAALRSYGLRCIDVRQIAPDVTSVVTSDSRPTAGGMKLVDPAGRYECK